MTFLVSVIALVLLSLPAVGSLFHPGFFVSDDGSWMIIRFTAFFQSLSEGQFPVRMLGRLNHLYGYPVANFLYPGYMYLATPLHILGLGFVDSIKVLFGFSMVASIVGMFLWLRTHFKPVYAFFGALMYVYTPYHLYDVYKRGSIGETLSLGVVPFCFYFISKKYVFLSSLAIGLLILSHNTLAVLFIPVIFIYSLLIIQKEKRSSWIAIKPFVLGLGLSAFFWIPAFYDLQYTKFSSIAVAEWREYFADIQLLGLSTIVIAMLSVIYLIRTRESKQSVKLPYFFFLVLLLSGFSSLSYSFFIWGVIPANFVQFPFRFLSLTIFAASVLSAWVLSQLSKKLSIVVGILLLGLSFFTSFYFLFPQEYVSYDEGFYTTNLATTTVKNEYMPKAVEKVADKIPNSSVEAMEGYITVLSQKFHDIHFQIDTKNAATVKINRLYFPGWKVSVDDKTAIIDEFTQEGAMIVQVPAGSHVVRARFSETPVRFVADLISLLAVGYVGIIFIKLLVKRVSILRKRNSL